MLKRHWRIISKMERVFDNLLVVGMFFLSYALRDSVLPFFVSVLEMFGLSTVSLSSSEELPKLAPLSEYLIILGIGLPLYNAMLSVNGAYRSMRLFSYFKIFRTCALSSVLVFFALGSFLYLFKLDFSRSFVALFCCLSTLAVFLLRLNVLTLLRFLRERGRNFRNLLIFGEGEQADDIESRLVSQSELGIKVVGRVVPASTLSGMPKVVVNAATSNDGAVRQLLCAEKFELALKEYAIDEVVFTEVVPNFEEVKQLAEVAVEEGVKVTFAADFFSLNIAKSDVSYLGEIPLLHYHSAPSSDYRPSLLIKRMFDFCVASLLLLVLSPLFLLTAIAIKLDSSGPVFFTQNRVGLNGRLFRMLKFRSMLVGSESKQAELEKDNEMEGPVFKLRNDPRITGVGRFIRKYSIDELPQLLNVVIGEMSLVGPRPPLKEEVLKYQRRQRKRLSMRPGLTCTWQVSGRNEIPDFETWAKLDLEYIENWSLWTDFKLLLRTIPAVLSGQGAS